MKTAAALTFAAIPAWTLPAQGDALAIFETIALAGLEGQWIRLSAADQRRVLGANVFGRQEIRVDAQGVQVCRSVGFGQDSETATYGLAQLRGAVATGTRLAPGLSGPSYYSGQH
jgi:hypothetical protein